MMGICSARPILGDCREGMTMRRHEILTPSANLRAMAMAVAIGLGTASISPAGAAQTDIAGPPGSVAFGAVVKALPNGNFVVVDATGQQSTGAVYLYASDGNLLSTLAGSSANDMVGSGGIVLLDDNRFLVVSPNWHNELAPGAGAVTWVDGDVGFDGPISDANSLVGTTTNDHVGSGGVTVLSNGNYVVVSPGWSNDTSATVGAVTWADGSSGITGAVSAANSLVGTTSFDLVGRDGVVALTNGNYVVVSTFWSDGATGGVGAVTWGSGADGITGQVSIDNSLVGSTADDVVGSGGVTPLTNGNYVVSSPRWDNGGTTDAGAATWGNGTGGTTGAVTTGNSLTSTASTSTGDFIVTALINGNYVVASPSWSDGAASSVGAVTWGNGNGGTVGPISVSNSLVGTVANDMVGVSGVVALDNGNYVVASSQWDHGGAANAGAATWGDGEAGVIGPVSVNNSLVGTSANDQVADGGVVALRNGNYVVVSSYWNNGNAFMAGAVTWRSGASSSAGAVTEANSLVGMAANDGVGNRGVTALSDGNYAVASSSWADGATFGAGAVTWGNGSVGTVGTVTTANSLTGTAVGDGVGSVGVVALDGGQYLAVSSLWNNGATHGVGAVTWCRADGVTTGPVTAFNSLIGTSAEDNVGSNDVRAFSDGYYVATNAAWHSGGFGAITLASGAFRLAGPVAPWNSVIGGVANGEFGMNYDYDPIRHRLIVGRPAENIVSLFSMDEPFADGFDP